MKCDFKRDFVPFVKCFDLLTLTSQIKLSKTNVLNEFELPHLGT